MTSQLETQAATPAPGVQQAGIVLGSRSAAEVVATNHDLTTRRTRWVHGYARRLLLTDLAVVAVAVALADVLRFEVAGAPATPGWVRALTSGVMAAVWCAWLAAERTREHRIVGHGTEEYRRVWRSALHLFGTVAIITLVLRVDVARGYLAVAFPLGGIGLLAGRWGWRHWLDRRRREGTHGTAVLVIGSASSAAEMTACLERDPSAGYRVVGVCVPGGADPTGVVTAPHHVVPVLGDVHDVRDAVRASGADTVAVTAADRLGHAGMRALAWELQELEVELVVAPGVVDVAGPRVSLRPAAGLPLVHLEEPRYRGAGRVGKRLFDVTLAALALVVLSPVLALAALAVRLDSRGPSLYRSERMGLAGSAFTMLKLRSMTADADTRVDELAGRSDGNGMLFKMRTDPRVTRVGAWLRRCSLDELPQLLNVLRGEMSLVGPRPPLRSEVERYSFDVRRRLLVKPGLTGLWQVSGRSDLSWEDTVRLDLTYVENWSMMTDLVILLRTARAVLAGRGAY